MVSILPAGESAFRFFEQSLSNRKGQSAMILSSSKAAIREVALTTRSGRSRASALRKSCYSAKGRRRALLIGILVWNDYLLAISVIISG
jgi:hypothetical protein